MKMKEIQGQGKGSDENPIILKFLLPPFAKKFSFPTRQTGEIFKIT